MPELHVLRVFCAPDGGGGNRLGVFLEGEEVPEERRQEVARQLGFSETVFVEARREGRVRLFTPATELGFAGHPLVGTAWLLRSEGTDATELRPPAGVAPVSYAEDLTFVAGRPQWAPEFQFVQLDAPEEVEALDGPRRGHELHGYWAWVDEAAGLIRERVFPLELGIDEDEATGAAAIRLCAQLERPIEIRQGRASVIYARPLDDGFVEIGGRVALDEVREHPI